MITPQSVKRDGEAMTPEYRDQIAAKFRTEIGGVYKFVAARIEQDHARLGRKPLTRQQWLVWCCAVGGMTVQQTAYSMSLHPDTISRHRNIVALKGWTWPFSKSSDGD